MKYRNNSIFGSSEFESDPPMQWTVPMAPVSVESSEHQRLKDAVVEAAREWYASAKGDTEALLPLYAAMSVLEVFEQKQ